MSLSFDLDTEIAAPPERVFAVLTDLDGARDWMPGCVGVEVLDRDEHGRAREWRETRKMWGHEATEHFEVTGLVPDTSIDLFCDGAKGTSGSGHFRFRYDLAPVGDGTSVRMHAEIGGGGRLARLVGRLMLGTFRKACKRDLDAMKAHIEAAGG